MENIPGSELNEQSYINRLRIAEDWKWKRVDLANDSTIVFDGQCRIGNIYVDAVMSAHACPILDGSNSFASLLASTAAGTLISAFKGSRFYSNLIIDPNDAATGTLLVQYQPAVFGDS